MKALEAAFGSTRLRGRGSSPGDLGCFVVLVSLLGLRNGCRSNFRAELSRVQLLEGVKEVCGVRRAQCYPGEAPSASATRRKVGRNGKDAGRCTITRRTETSTRAPSFNNRSRSVQT